MTEFSELSLTITKAITKQEKKDNGIFITPQSIISSLLSLVIGSLPINVFNADSLSNCDVLEPSCGTCEFIHYIDKYFNNVRVDGIELNKQIFERTQHLTFKNNVTLYNCDFADFVQTKQYDLIIGNPPYVVCKKTQIPKEYHSHIIGRPNLFCMFIIKSIDLLKPGGILAFIIPSSFLNSAYYSKIRDLVKCSCEILHCRDFTNVGQFLDTKQEIIGLVVRKKQQFIELPDECTFSIKLNNDFIFSPNINELRNIFQGATTLSKLGLTVKTGNIVWNEHKEELTNDPSCALLIYNTNITNDNTLQLCDFKNDEKKQYILADGDNKVCLVVNRGNGNSAYKLKYAIIDRDDEYFVENHLNVIYSDTLCKKEAIVLFNKIMTSFKNPKTQHFINIFLGNNGLSKTELETIFPIYL
jgi:adenine-specific DNA-methyltransferase